MSTIPPFLQFTIEATDKAEMAAARAGVNVTQVLGGLVRIWKWCWQRKSLAVDQELINGVCMSPAAGGSLVSALIFVGFLETVEGQLLVKDDKDRLGIRKFTNRQAGAEKSRALLAAKRAAELEAERLQSGANVQFSDHGSDQSSIRSDQRHQTSKHPNIHLTTTPFPPTGAAEDQPAEPGTLARAGVADSSGGVGCVPLRAVQTRATQDRRRGKRRAADAGHALLGMLAEVYRARFGVAYRVSKRDRAAVLELEEQGSHAEAADVFAYGLGVDGYEGCRAVHELPWKWARLEALRNSRPKEGAQAGRGCERNVGAGERQGASDEARQAVAVWLGEGVGSARVGAIAEGVEHGDPAHVPGWLTACGYSDAVVAKAVEWMGGQRRVAA